MHGCESQDMSANYSSPESGVVSMYSCELLPAWSSSGDAVCPSQCKAGGGGGGGLFYRWSCICP